MLNKILGLLLVATSANAITLDTEAEGGQFDDLFEKPDSEKKFVKFEHKDLYGIGDKESIHTKYFGEVPGHVMLKCREMGYNAFTITGGMIYFKDIRPRFEHKFLTDNWDSTTYALE